MYCASFVQAVTALTQTQVIMVHNIIINKVFTCDFFFLTGNKIMDYNGISWWGFSFRFGEKYDFALIILPLTHFHKWRP